MSKVSETLNKLCGFNPEQDTSEDGDINEAEQSLKSLVTGCMEEKIAQSIVIKAHDCKENGEDCLFGKCVRWEMCEVLKKEILSEVRKALGKIFEEEK